MKNCIVLVIQKVSIVAVNIRDSFLFLGNIIRYNSVIDYSNEYMLRPINEYIKTK